MDISKKLRNTTGRNKMWGVFKACMVFFLTENWHSMTITGCILIELTWFMKVHLMGWKLFYLTAEQKGWITFLQCRH